MVEMCARLLVLLLLMTSLAVAQENEVECLTGCGADARILSVVRTVGECCASGQPGGAYNFPGSGQIFDCSPCTDYRNIAGEIGFDFQPQYIVFTDSLTAECVVITQAGLRDPSASIAWLAPNGSLVASNVNVPFTPVTRQIGGQTIQQQEARFPLDFASFGQTDVGEYTCIASIISPDFPGRQTDVFRTVQIPSSVDPAQVDTPVLPVQDQNSNPVAGQPYTIDCYVNTPGLTNDSIMWVGPDNVPITATTGRVSVGDVFQRDRRSIRTITFNPLSTEDSGPYTCRSPNSVGIQTLTVDVPEPDTRINTIPPDPVEEQPLQINCSSVLPPSLEGEVTVTLLAPDGTVLGENTGTNGAITNFTINQPTSENNGEYTCRVVVRSRFLTDPDGNPRPLEDEETIPVNVTTITSPVNECVTGEDNCDVNAVCEDLPDGFRCTCREGYNGTGVRGDCQDINECEESIDDCNVDELCINTIGNFVCHPLPNISECANGRVCDENAECMDTPGSYQCTCFSGYSGDGHSCQDIDECLNRPCHENATCTNSRGSYSCQCNTGFTGNGTICNASFPMLSVPTNGDIEYLSRTDKVEAVFTCNTGYGLVGYPVLTFYQSWDRQPPECQRICDVTPPPPATPARVENVRSSECGRLEWDAQEGVTYKLRFYTGTSYFATPSRERKIISTETNSLTLIGQNLTRKRPLYVIVKARNSNGIHSSRWSAPIIAAGIGCLQN